MNFSFNRPFIQFILNTDSVPDFVREANMLVLGFSRFCFQALSPLSVSFFSLPVPLSPVSPPPLLIHEEILSPQFQSLDYKHLCRLPVTSVNTRSPAWTEAWAALSCLHA